MLIREKAHIGWAFSLLAVVAANVSASTLFERSDVIEITLEGPISRLIKKADKSLEAPFNLTVDGIEQAIDVRVRGHSRLRVCEFPPLRFNFPESNGGDTVFAGQDKLKLVTHCRNHDRAEQDLLEEFAVYRVLNAITDAGYRVRLLRINYIDTLGKLSKKAAVRYGFVLETDDQIADRLGVKRARLAGVPVRMLDEKQSATVYVFQYLVGNTDWSLVRADYDDECCHNIKLFERDGKLLFVPYDFDLTGVVNAGYAYPDPLLRIDKVTDRLYRGKCVSRDALEVGLQSVLDRKDAVLAVPTEIPGLGEQGAERMTRYLENFFDRAEERSKLVKQFERRCL